MSSNPYQPPAPVRADVGPPLRDLGALTLLITIVFAFMAVTLVTTGVATSLLVNRPGDVGLQGAPDPVVAVVALSALSYVVFLVVGIALFCVFVYRANVNADALVPSGMEFTPGWAVGWFFVPLANLFKPYQVVSEIYRASVPEADPDFWSVASVPFYLPLWWGSWIAFNLISGWNRPLFQDPMSPRTPGQGAFLLEAALGALAAVLAIVVVRKIHGLQREKARRARVRADAPVIPRTNPLL
jgi:hypothetical protein